MWTPVYISYAAPQGGVLAFLVDGVFTANPRIEPGIGRIKEILYDEMSEMSGLGAKVVQLRAVELARQCGVVLLVRSSFSDGSRW